MPTLYTLVIYFLFTNIIIIIFKFISIYQRTLFVVLHWRITRCISHEHLAPFLPTGMLFNVSVGFSDLVNKSPSDKRGKTYALFIGDTVSVNEVSGITLSLSLSAWSLQVGSSCLSILSHLLSSRKDSHISTGKNCNHNETVVTYLSHLE